MDILSAKKMVLSKDSRWIVFIIVLTMLAFVVNYYSYFYDITDSASNLFLLPIIIAAFYYRKKGFIFSLVIISLFLTMLSIIDPDPYLVINTGDNAIIMVGVAGIVTLVSLALGRSENKYRLLFETSPSPLITILPGGNVSEVNRKFTEMFGYTADEIAGEEFKNLSFIPDECKDVASGLTSSFKENSEEEFINIVSKNGVLHFCKAFSASLYSDDGKNEGFIVSLTDITENITAQRKIETSLREKETLLKEVHHRVKNNLQIIVAMISLQIRRTDDYDTVRILRDFRNRVYTMARVHENLYQSESLSAINVKNFLRTLGRDVIVQYTLPDRNIGLVVDVEGDPEMDLDMIIPLALITNELMTNSLKYAFSEGETGDINLSFSEENNEYFVYRYSDNGTINRDLIFNQEKSGLGMKIITSLVDQLNGDFDITPDYKEIIIKFPNKIYYSNSQPQG
ncbi:sensor histidine kinase [Methanoplanus endosymbiosus]|uniref:histidine kinase n=1 Tax=Methanoplanus endosymbiosus TaxID=33865 RepID=A0A9E7PJN9_9EURY|nr:histidine kinase dimerization/phosphoacceptor domain -containing protein [Methanoplanus endosymbiosus]UUX91175.1 PAS domain S-box protein [Methanoplanus endosymbiosus]